jgi:hypothetical protein
VKSLNVHPSHLVSHRHNVAVSLSYDRLPSGHSPRSADTNPQTDASSGTNRVTKDEKFLGWSLILLIVELSSEDHSRLAPPWQEWELDSNFFYELKEWNNAHKDDKLPVVLANVNSVLESKPFEVALEFIPNSPFPAKSLVTALVNLFLLGSVSDVSSQIPCQLPILIVSHPPRKFLRQSWTSIAFLIRSLLISPTWP